MQEIKSASFSSFHVKNHLDFRVTGTSYRILVDMVRMLLRESIVGYLFLPHLSWLSSKSSRTSESSSCRSVILSSKNHLAANSETAVTVMREKTRAADGKPFLAMTRGRDVKVIEACHKYHCCPISCFL
jgi:hypothetical protein